VEFSKKEESRTDDRKIVLSKDYLKIGERAEQNGDIDGAIQAYQSTEKAHPDYSEAHHRLAQIYLDDRNDYDAAIREFENVLSLPENQQLVLKQYAVAFTNLGHAYYEKGSALVQKDKDAAAQNFAKALQNLQIAKQNTRFFPTMHYDEALHDTYYYTALSYHKLYLITKKTTILNSANLAWREYFDFFPKKLEGNSTFEQSREAAQKYWDQIKNL
jgi:tetratricopeptide (TPR) repeat protein